MSDRADDLVEFDDVLTLALATLAPPAAPRPDVRARLLASIVQPTEPPPLPRGFSIRRDVEDDWQPHAVPGIRMKVLAVNPDTGYLTLLLDVQPGTRFPAHHHHGAEECFVISGTVHTLGHRLGAGDFIHADGGTDHAELWTEEGARVLLIVPPEDAGV